MGKDSPPVLKADNYNQWRKAITLWKGCSGVSDKDQGPRVALSLTGKPSEIAMLIDADKLQAETGLDTLLTELDKLYKTDIIEQTFIAINNLESYTRPENVTIAEYINEWNRLKTIVYDIRKADAYEDGVAATKLLNQANLPVSEANLIRATITTLTYDNMIMSLKRVYGQRTSDVNRETSRMTNAIKHEVMMQEEVDPYYYDPYDYYYEEQVEPEETYYNNNNRGSYRGNFSRGRGARRPNYYQRQHNFQERSNQPQGGYPKNQSENRGGTKCHICDSKFHWANECPDKHRKINLYTSDTDELIMLVNETLNHALVDSGARSTCCGKQWYDCYHDSLTEAQKAEITDTDEFKSFRFGDGYAVNSTVAKSIPITLCGKEVMLKTSIVDCDIPLLLSKRAMKNTNMKLDCETDLATIRIDGELYSEKMKETDSGHYALPISVPRTEEIDTILVCDDDTPDKVARHLHKYFCHASTERIAKTVKNAELKNRDDVIKCLDQIEKSCDFCLKYKRSKPRPKSGLPLASNFNEVICIDLKQLNDTKRWILHIVDNLTRFAMAVFVKDKSTEEIIRKLFQCWISIFGSPLRILNDNGGEFNSYEFQEMAATMGIKVLTTPAEAPWSNGTVERHNDVLAKMVYKIQQDTGCCEEIALSWALQAKNSLVNVYGFSPYQLVIGRNPNVPNILRESLKLTDLNESVYSKIVSDNINALQSSRQAFMKAENSMRLKRALKSRISGNQNVRFITGDIVYYKRKDKKNWIGPATVIAQDYKQVLIKSGGLVVRVHPCKVILKESADVAINQSQDSTDVAINQDQTPLHQYENRSATEPQHKTREQSRENSSRITRSHSNTLVEDTCETGDSSDSDSEDEENDKTQEYAIEDREEVVISELETTEETAMPDLEPTEEEEAVSTHLFASSDERPRMTVSEWTPVENRVKIGDEIRFKFDETDPEWTQVTIIEPAGKKGGLYDTFYNVDSTDDGSYCLDIAAYAKIEKRAVIHDGNKVSHTPALDNDKNADQIQVENLLFTCDDTTFHTWNDKLTKKDFQKDEVKEAMDLEHQNWKKFGVFQEVPRGQDQNIISCRWVISEKFDEKNERSVKARLVARGYEETGLNVVTSPTASKAALRVFLTVTQAQNWKIECLDVKSAYLQSHALKRELYLQPPVEYRTEGHVWKLIKPVYGLGDSGRMWYLTLSAELINLGGSKCQDGAVFRFHDKDGFNGLLLVHVDDFLCAGNQRFMTDVIGKLLKKYLFSKHDACSNFTYIGWNISQGEDAININQTEYVESVQQIPVSRIDQRNKERLLDSQEIKLYQGLLGKINWVATQTRPDLSFNVYQASIHQKSPSVEHLIALNNAQKKLVNGPKKLIIPRLDQDITTWKIVVFADGSYKNVAPEKIKSGKGYVILIVAHDKCVIVEWKSNSVRRVVHNVLGSETLSLCDSLGAAISIKAQLLQIVFNDKRYKEDTLLPISANIDSKQLHDLLINKSASIDQRLNVEVAEIVEMIETKVVDDVKLVKTNTNIANSLTKRDAPTRDLNDLVENGLYSELEGKSLKL